MWPLPLYYECTGGPVRLGDVYLSCLIVVGQIPASVNCVIGEEVGGGKEDGLVSLSRGHVLHASLNKFV